MISRLWTVYAVELLKATRLKQTFVGPILVLLVVLCALLVHPVARDGASDYGFVAYVTPVALNSLGFLLLLAYCAGLVSQELNSGTIRQVLVRPVRRHEYMLAKLLLGMTYALLLAGIVAVSGWGIAYLFGEMTGVTFGGELVYTTEEMWGAYLLGLALCLAPLTAGVAYAVMLSTFTRSTVTAVSSAVGIWIVLDMIKYPLRIERYVFTTYLESPWQVFVNRCDAIETAWFPMAWYCLASSGGVFVLCSAVAILVMQRRNLG